MVRIDDPGDNCVVMGGRGRVNTCIFLMFTVGGTPVCVCPDGALSATEASVLVLVVVLAEKCR
jgi:hypothetical protein